MSNGDDVIDRLRELAATGRQIDPMTVVDQLDQCHAEIAQLEVAIEHRTVIGQAIGILIERYGIDSDSAFSVLKRISSERNEKLYAIAKQLCTTGHSGHL